MCGYHPPAMSKFLLLFLFGVMIYLVLKRAKRTPPDKPKAVPPAETMIECAYCGLHVPLGESVAAADRRYCCEEHRRLGQG